MQRAAAACDAVGNEIPGRGNTKIPSKFSTPKSPSDKSRTNKFGLAKSTTSEIRILEATVDNDRVRNNFDGESHKEE